MTPPSNRREPKRPPPIEAYRWFFALAKARRSKGVVTGTALESLIAARRQPARGQAPKSAAPRRSLGAHCLNLIQATLHSWGPAEWLLTAALGITLIGALVTAARRADIPSDPHLTSALQTLKVYESGKAPWERNYRDPAYATALRELSLVEEASPWIGEARRLKNDINEHIAKSEQGPDGQRSLLASRAQGEAGGRLLPDRTPRPGTTVGNGGGGRMTAEGSR